MRHVATALLCLAVLTGCGAEPDSADLVASARAYLEKRDVKAAIIQLKGALDADARSSEARTLLGKALLQDSDPAGAEIELRKALEYGAPREQVVPTLAHALLQAGQFRELVAKFGADSLQDPVADAELKMNVAAAYAQLGDRDKARSTLALALMKQPNHEAARLVNARLLAMDGDIDGAMRELDVLLSKDPAHVHAGPAKADLLWRGKGDQAMALALHRRILEAHPAAVSSHASTVSILFGDGRTAESREQFERMKAAAPKHPETLFFDAQFAYLDKDLSRSRELTDLVLIAVPDHFRALELAAAAEYQAGDDALAQSFADRALRVNPGLLTARQVMARSLLRTGQPDKAVEMLKPLLANDGVDGGTLVLAGEIYLQMGDVRNADAAFRRAAQVAPNDPKVRTKIALAQLKAGRGTAILDELESIAMGDKATHADLALISARMTQGDIPGALQAIEKLEQKTPQSPVPDQLRGQVLVTKRDVQGARRSFEAALAKDKKYMPAINALASLDMIGGEPTAARKRFTDLLATDPRNAQAILALSEIAAASGTSPQEIRRYYDDGIRAAPRDAAMRRLHVTHLLKSGDPASALAAAQQAVGVLPDHLGMMELLGQTQIAAGEANQALATFRRLIALQPANPNYHMHMAEAYVALREAEPASQALKKALELDPNLAEARRGLALLQLRSDRPQEALAIAREWQKRSPKEGAPFALEGDIESSRGNWSATIAAYQTALKLSEASEAAMKLHAALLAAGHPRDAERVAAEWEKKRPMDPAFRFYLGDVAVRERNYAVAEQHYRAVLSRQPGNAMALNNVAWLLLRQSKPGALELAQRADALMPNRAPILDTLGAAQAAAGKIPDAIETQRRALAGSPQDARMKLNLARYLLQAGERSEAREHLISLARLGKKFNQQAEVAAMLKSL